MRFSRKGTQNFVESQAFRSFFIVVKTHSVNFAHQSVKTNNFPPSAMPIFKKICIFALAMNISSFLIGVATAFFTIFALHILFWRQERTRFQTVVGVIMAIWAIWCAKDLLITFPGMYKRQVLDWILIIDGWSAITYTVLLFEVVSPGWTSWRHLILLSLPFAAFTIAYSVWPVRDIVYVYSAFLWCYAWTVVIIVYRRMRRYLRYVHSEYSNIDHIDASWLQPVIIFAIVGQLAWLFTSLYATVLTDIVYYISIIALWLLVLHYSWDFRPITITDTNNTCHQKDTLPITRGTLEQIVEEQQLYLNKNLTLQDLAQALNTNRTYVSNYIGQVIGLTFYDYINQLRIERVSLPMMREHPEYKLEHVAKESGFASISTFRRAFVKFTGQTPSQYEFTITNPA